MREEKLPLRTFGVIVDYRETRNSEHYLIKWRGLPSSENTWEKKEDVPEGIIGRFKANNLQTKFAYGAMRSGVKRVHSRSKSDGPSSDKKSKQSKHRVSSMDVSASANLETNISPSPGSLSGEHGNTFDQIENTSDSSAPFEQRAKTDNENVISDMPPGNRTEENSQGLDNDITINCNDSELEAGYGDCREEPVYPGCIYDSDVRHLPNRLPSNCDDSNQLDRWNIGENISDSSDDASHNKNTGRLSEEREAVRSTPDTVSNGTAACTGDSILDNSVEGTSANTLDSTSDRTPPDSSPDSTTANTLGSTSGSTPVSSLDSSFGSRHGNVSPHKYLPDLETTNDSRQEPDASINISEKQSGSNSSVCICENMSSPTLSDKTCSSQGQGHNTIVEEIHLNSSESVVQLNDNLMVNSLMFPNVTKEDDDNRPESLKTQAMEEIFSLFVDHTTDLNSDSSVHQMTISDWVDYLMST